MIMLTSLPPKMVVNAIKPTFLVNPDEMFSKLEIENPPEFKFDQNIPLSTILASDGKIHLPSITLDKLIVFFISIIFAPFRVLEVNLTEMTVQLVDFGLIKPIIESMFNSNCSFQLGKFQPLNVLYI